MKLNTIRNKLRNKKLQFALLRCLVGFFINLKT